MSRWLLVSLCCIPVAIVGSLIGIFSGAVGVCGDGGWGVVPFLIGCSALLTFLVTFPTWIVRAIWFRVHAAKR